MAFAAAAAPFIAAGASAASGLASIGMGRAALAEGKARQQELEREAQLAETAGKESNASRLEELRRTIGGIRALAGARNINVDSPSAQALEASARTFADRDRQREAFNIRQGVSATRLAGTAAKAAGKARRTAFFLQAGSSFLKGAAEAGAFKKTGIG